MPIHQLSWHGTSSFQNVNKIEIRISIAFCEFNQSARDLEKKGISDVSNDREGNYRWTNKLDEIGSNLDCFDSKSWPRAPSPILKNLLHFNPTKRKFHPFRLQLIISQLNKGCSLGMKLSLGSWCIRLIVLICLHQTSLSSYRPSCSNSSFKWRHNGTEPCTIIIWSAQHGITQHFVAI